MKSAYKDSVVMWQAEPEEGLPEPALLVEFYSDSICIRQDGNAISINYESIADLCKLLKSRPKP